MKRLASFAVAMLFLALPLFSEAQNDPLIHDVFMVKSAEVFITDEGVYVNFIFWERSRLNRLIVPERMLEVKIDATNSNSLEAEYYEVCSPLVGCNSKPAKVVLSVARQSIADAWSKMLQQALSDYKKLRTAPIIPTYKK